MSGGSTPAGAVPSRGRRRHVPGALAAVVAVGVTAAFGLYGRQIVSYVSHIRGSPTQTEPLAPFPAGAGPLYRIAVAGDVGYANDRAAKTGAAIVAAGAFRPYDALLLLGDNVYPAGDPARLPVTVFEPFGPVLDTGARLMAILGNHDVMDGHAGAQVAALGMPGRWYSEVIGDLTFVALDSNDPYNPDQLAWLEQTLAAARTTWKIVALHHPPYSAGYQGSSLDARQVFSPLFERYGVQLALSGHEHDYQRSVPVNGVTYIVSGGAADTRRSGKDDFTAVSVSWHHFVDLNVFADHLLVRGVNQSGRVFDQVTIQPRLSEN
ncbi:MAG TPA: metallophosphoesterase [Acidimicrobiales bacterium]|nr:metallophosphoesterase [Acidimicrobiales bacterium]